MKKMRFYCVMLLGMVLNTTLSYTEASSGMLKGKIVDKEGPIAFANVVLLHPDSTFLDGTITDTEGIFNFENIELGNRLLKLSFVGYDTHVMEVNIVSGQNDIGIIEMETSGIRLGEVTITANRPVFKMENGNLVTMVSNSLLSTLGTAGDILERIPGIDYKNNSIQVFGKGTPVIYVNNRKLHDISELEQIQSGDILSVELIKNPGARYDATDRAVIVIKTKKRRVVFPHSFLTG